MAELEILESLVGFLCPTSESASACRDFISSHSSVLPPVGPLFYFLLFPLVFTILFIYILSSTILHGGNLTKGMRLLIGISVFIFIIISGWYPIMLVLSEFWFIMIIVLGGLYYFLTRHRGGEGGAPGGGPKGQMPGLNSQNLQNQIWNRVFFRMSGQEQRMEKMVDMALKEMKNLVDASKNDPNVWRSYASRIDYCWGVIKAYKDAISIQSIPIGGRLGQKIKELEAVLNQIETKEIKTEQHLKKAA